MTQNVVLVDDSAPNLTSLGAAFGDIPDVTVHTFGSSSEALAWANVNRADAFLLDYQMPEPDGLAMVRLLRADSRFAHVPIVIITSEHEFDVRLAALAAGANDFLERPIERREVLSRVRTLLMVDAVRAGLAEHAADLETSLAVAERRARAQAERLATLWHVAHASRDPSNDETLQAVMNEAAAAIRPGQPFFGSLMRVDGDDFVLLAAARPQLVLNRLRSLAQLGTHMPIADFPHRLALSSGTTLAWDDVALDPAVADLRQVRLQSVRAQISTPFEVARKTYVLTFTSTEPVHEPFGPEDHTYIELLGDFFANQIQRAEHSDRLLHHLSHDSLTGLRNRTQFRLDARGTLAGGTGGAMAVVSIDTFRAVNQTFGHIIGDALLVEIGAALEQAVDGNGVVGRLSGDTFGAFLSDMTTDEQLLARLATLTDVFTRPFSTGDRAGKEFIPVGATIGAALANGNDGIDQLLSHADAAVFAAKQRGRGNVEVYRPGMESEAGSRARTALALSQAVEGDELELYFQPHLDLRTMAVSGAEALIRWNHRERGLLPPDDFIPFAELHGLIKPITRWVMNAALAASERLGALDPAFRLYFNLSALDVSDGQIVDDFRAAARAGRSLANIGVELTESAAMADLGTATRIVEHLQELGVSVAVDDFGTGFSSLALLRRMPADIIKIDRTFIAEVLAEQRDAAITEAIIAGGKRLGYETVAEGVESDAQIAWLRERGCRYIQGYVVARPQPLPAFLEWLKNRPLPVGVA